MASIDSSSKLTIGDKLLGLFGVKPKPAVGEGRIVIKSLKVVSVWQPIGEVISTETVYTPTSS